MRGCLFFIALIFSSASIAQQTPQHWYLLKSAAPIYVTDAKEPLELIRTFVETDSCWFNDKSDTFTLASNYEVDTQALADFMNGYGYYIADITSGELPNSEVGERASLNFQKEKWIAEHPTEYESAQQGIIRITQSEFDSLPFDKKESLIASGNYEITEE